MAALNSTGRNSFVFGVLRVGGTRPPRPFTYYFYRIFISLWPSSLSFLLHPRTSHFFFARAALRPRDVEEILGWMLVRVFQVFCVKILVIVVDVVD